MQTIEDPDVADCDLSSDEVILFHRILFRLESEKLSSVMALFSHFSSDDMEEVWEVLLDWLLFRQRWTEALWLLE